MKFKIDENLPIELAELLKQAGYDTATVFEQHLAGGTDDTVVMVCQKEQRILITLDMDFADIREYPPNQFPGFLVLRLKKQGKSSIMETFERILNLLSSESLIHKLWIVEENRVRIRS